MPPSTCDPLTEHNKVGQLLPLHQLEFLPKLSTRAVLRVPVMPKKSQVWYHEYFQEDIFSSMKKLLLCTRRHAPSALFWERAAVMHSW